MNRGANGRAKGKRGELEAAKAIRDAWGVLPRRTAQVDGGLSGDLVGVNGVHIEVKRTGRIGAFRFLEQAIRDSMAPTASQRGAVPVVVMREDAPPGREAPPWALVVRLDDFRELAAKVVRADRRHDHARRVAEAYVAWRDEPDGGEPFPPDELLDGLRDLAGMLGVDPRQTAEKPVSGPGGAEAQDDARRPRGVGAAFAEAWGAGKGSP